MCLSLLVAGPSLAQPPAPGASPAPAAIAEPIAEPIDVRDALAHTLRYTVTLEGAGSYGAGVLVGAAADRVLTALHVIEPMHGAPEIHFLDGSTARAELLEVDRELDLALLRVVARPRESAIAVAGSPPTSSAPAAKERGLRIADATQLRAGDDLYAVGCPRRLGHTVSRGVVSYVGRAMDGVRYLQTDLPINDGNSGGPVVDARGQLVGIMSFIIRSAQGLSFALPINYALERFAVLGPIPDEAAYLDRFRRWRGSAEHK